MTSSRLLLPGAVRELLRLGLSFEDISYAMDVPRQRVRGLAQMHGFVESNGCYRDQLNAYAQSLQPDRIARTLTGAETRSVRYALNSHLEIEDAIDFVQMHIDAHMTIAETTNDASPGSAISKTMTTVDECLRLIAKNLRPTPNNLEAFVSMGISHYEWKHGLFRRAKRRKTHIHLVR